jgi:hypothetical protein
MTSIEVALPSRLPHSVLAAATLWVFAASLFLSALLLFSVQPMFTKMVLPTLGGSPGVWSVAIVFFQAMLLCGYVYAHLLTRHVPIRLAVVLHLGVLLAALAAMPIALAPGFGRPPVDSAAPWLISLFAVSVGLPFFAVSTNGPLLQAWFARTGHPQAKDPYFLYGASNLGSFVALVAYPLAIEPISTLHEQFLLWRSGYLALAAAIGICGVLLLRSTGARVAVLPDPASEVASASPGWWDRLRWCALAFVPSALLVAVTAHVATDVASAPFLWVPPLALFLLSFVLVFRDRPLISHALLLRVQPAAIAVLICVTVMGRVPSCSSFSPSISEPSWSSR